MTTPRTICVKCKWHDGLGQIWYDHFCEHPKVSTPAHIDPVTGKRVADKHPNCRDINRGDCELYKEKS